MEEKLKIIKENIINNNEYSAKTYCKIMLQKVSRTFALTIRALGQPFRDPVLVGYLFCRIADTYEDSEKLEYKNKIEALELFKSFFVEDSYKEEKVNKIKELCSVFENDDDEEFLALNFEAVFIEFNKFPKDVRAIMANPIIEMIEGMQKTVTKQHEQPQVGTDSQEELEQYCYYVAGTVGIMLTDLFKYYSPWIGEKLYGELSNYKIAFGEALQLTNIIKDAMGDLQRGVSFLPKDLASEYGIDLAELYLPKYREQATNIMKDLIIKAVNDLNDALIYTILLPKQEPRMRIFCIMPILFSIKTLAVAVENFDDLLDPNSKVKISRDDVKKTIHFITFNVLWDYQLVKSYEKDLKRIEKALGIDVKIPFKKAGLLPIIHIDK